jgi:ATP-binding cassette subfamily B (MDR/TAP) protein 6
MWADQVSSNDGISVAGNSLKKEQSQASFKRDGSVKGYDAEPITSEDNVLEDPSNFIEEPENVPKSSEDKQDTEAAPTSAEEPETLNKGTDGLEKPHESSADLKEDQAEETPAAATKSAPETQVIAFPSSAPVEEEESQQIRESPKNDPISLENSGGDKSDIAAPAPIAFPTEESTPEKPQAQSPPAVTFGASAFSPPRTGTPDPESEPKRKRISSQNFQRLARRISLTTRRQNSVSSMLPDILKRDSSPRVSTDEGTSQRGEGSSTLVGSDSPAGSVRGDETPKLKKSKKEKKKKGTL